MRRMTVALALVSGLAGPAIARAQGAADAQFAATTLNLSAYGEVKLPPDMATLTLGVQTTAATASGALAANAEQMNRIVATLRRAGLADRDIQTSQLSLAPQYAYKEGQAPQLTGYQASNDVAISVNDLSRVGRVVDAVVGAGATNVNQISFGVANPLAAENAARVAAVKALQDKARLYADAAGYRIGRLVNLSEGGGYAPTPPRPMMAMAFKSAAPTPVEAGEIDVRVDVSGVFELAK
ncbi:MAG TPA: SIMPL domain-containing protein [Caulobacteraceae bacterium]